MSMTPLPGWYPDPSAPASQRWWDGSAWTEHRRAQPPAPATVPVGFGPARPAPGRRPGRGKAVALAVSALVVVAAVVTGVTVLGGGKDGAAPAAGGASSAPPATGAPGPTAPGSASPSPSRTDPSVVADDLNGITLPVLAGWTKSEDSVEDTLMLTTPGTYDCPGDPGLCRHGKVGSSTVTGNDETSPKAVAKADISDAADHFYDRDALDNRPFDGITGHQELKEGAVAVAGRAGYMVRWRVRTGSGPGGYVESLVFPSSVGTESLVCVRFAFDAGPGGPPLSDMDRITKGIRSVDDAAAGGGAGSGLGPSR
ncbi:membrane protein [Streptomyces sulfonofaciens]|uniref:Membrane protein n=1 Tax=Streptomyces sulfonofaciens TaxID=68272 RepID=A0A919G121_9ACTN|nr:DUF2510 domain-containing protein [Streptomyces sulfonofaciens]GHH75496.1 membrane protein [Streptomyces sulfonofaciens]